MESNGHGFRKTFPIHKVSWPELWLTYFQGLSFREGIFHSWMNLDQDKPESPCHVMWIGVKPGSLNRVVGSI